MTKKLRIGWFSFSCCEDSTIMFTEILNDHYQEWLPLLDIRYAKVLKSKNVMDEMDVAFVEGAIAAPDQEEKLLEIRRLAKKVVAIGSCAVSGNFSTQRNEFPEEVEQKISFLLEKFHYGKKAKKLDEIITVDAAVNGCPMQEEAFLKVLNNALVEFGIVPAQQP
jgi:sulfhydrogenase subunit delta